MKKAYQVRFSRKGSLGNYSTYDVGAASVAGAIKKATAIHKKESDGRFAVEVTKVELMMILDA